MNVLKLTTGFGAVLAYGASYLFLTGGYPQLPLMIALFASSGAIALIIVEWSQA